MNIADRYVGKKTRKAYGAADAKNRRSSKVPALEAHIRSVLWGKDTPPLEDPRWIAYYEIRDRLVAEGVQIFNQRIQKDHINYMIRVVARKAEYRSTKEALQ